MCYSDAGIRQEVNKIFTTLKAICSRILKPTYLHQHSDDYEIHRNGELKKIFPFCGLFFFFLLIYHRKNLLKIV